MGRQNRFYRDIRRHVYQQNKTSFHLEVRSNERSKKFHREMKKQICSYQKSHNDPVYPEEEGLRRDKKKDSCSFDFP